MNVGYAKMGRSFNLDLTKASVAGGDVDVVRTLHRLATARPNDTFWIIGRNSGECPQDVGFPPNVRNMWGEEPLKSMKMTAKAREKTEWTEPLWDAFAKELLDLDHIIMWLGQHGTSNRDGGLPQVKDRTKRTKPLDSCILYCGYMLETINRWRDVDPIAREEIWLCPDPRNYIKCRDNRWPLHHPVIAQYDQDRDVRHERYEIPGSPSDFGFADVAWVDSEKGLGQWLAKSRYEYSALELTALPFPDRAPFNLDGERVPFGIISNENRAYVANDRLGALKKWVLGWCPNVPLYGIWGDKSQEQLGRTIGPVPFLSMLPTMATFRSTFTMPASGSEWATAKPWEAFAVGTVCFFHPKYDGQNHILNGLDDYTRNFLRVSNPAELEARVQQLNDTEVYTYVANAQRAHYEKRFAETQGGILPMLERLT